MKRGWVLLLALSVGLNAGLMYVQLTGFEKRGAQPPPGGPFPGERGDRHSRPEREPRDPESYARSHLQRMTDILGLDNGQQQAIGEILSEYFPEIISYEETVREVRNRLVYQYAQPQTKTDTIRSLVREMNEIQVRLDSLVAETMLREIEHLTPDQRKRYIEIVPWGSPTQPPSHRPDREPPGRPPQDRSGGPHDRRPPPRTG